MTGRLRLTCLSAPAELAAARDEWDAFVLAAGSDIYFAADWLLAWWEFYGAGRTMRCYMVHDEEARPVAMLPFFVRTVRIGPVAVRHAGFIGADSTIPVFTPPVTAGCEAGVLEAVLDDLMQAAGCDVISLSPLSGRSDLPDALTAPGGIAARFHVAETGQPVPHSVFELPASLDAYLAALSKRTRKHFRRDYRILEREYGITGVEISGPEALDRFDEFVSMHDIQWQAIGKLGHFGDWPASTAFNRHLIERMAKNRQARLYILSDRDGNALAMEYYFVLGGHAFWRLGARILDEELDRRGIGRVVLFKVFEQLIAGGVHFIEAGPGHYPYKLRVGAGELPLRRLAVCRATLPARMKLALLTGWADLLNLVYYRVWFLKLAPRLGRTGKPLWDVWIRSRF